MREREDGGGWFVSATAQAAQERLKSAEARVELLKKELEGAQHTLAVLRDPWAGIKVGECRIYENNGRTFARAVVSESTLDGRWLLEVVK